MFYSSGLENLILTRHLQNSSDELLILSGWTGPSPIIKLSNLNTIEDALLLLERFNKSIAEKLFQNLANTIEKRSFAYVNRYVKTDMKIAAIIFDRKRKIRWSGINGKDYISFFHCD